MHTQSQLLLRGKILKKKIYYVKFWNDKNWSKFHIGIVYFCIFKYFLSSFQRFSHTILDSTQICLHKLKMPIKNVFWLIVNRRSIIGVYVIVVWARWGGCCAGWCSARRRRWCWAMCRAWTACSSSAWTYSWCARWRTTP